MKKLLFFFIVFISLLTFNSVLAETLTHEIQLDKDYTKKYPLTFKDGIFTINKYTISSFISIDGVEKTLSNSKLSNSYSVIDYGYKRKWGLTITTPLKTVDYVGFTIDCEHYRGYVYHCGNIEVDFSDIKDSGYDLTIDDRRIYVRGNFLFSDIILDPTDQLLPNATNKAYLVSSTSTDSPNQATTEFTSLEYGRVVTSNNDYVVSTAQDPITTSCSLSKNYYWCYWNGESCSQVRSTCTSRSACLNGTACSLASCSALTNAVGSSAGCGMTPNINGYFCSCYENMCSGGVNCVMPPPYYCTATGSCYYTCDDGWYSCDSNDVNGCEVHPLTSTCYTFTFQRFTFNVSSFNMSTSNMTYCWEGYYNGYSTTDGKLLYYNNNTATWTVWKTLTNNVETTSCIYFDINNNTIYNKTSKLVQFAVRGNQSKTGATLTVLSDYSYLNVSYPSIVTTTTTTIPIPVKTLFECEEKLCYESLKLEPKFVKIAECDMDNYYPYFLIFADTNNLLWNIICDSQSYSSFFYRYLQSWL
jgi:hypothetical protein